jgi:membrane associated rhomboid family serine protease
MLIIPTRVETLMERWPWANFAIIGITVLVSITALAGVLEEGLLSRMVLSDWAASGLLGHLTLHAGFLHLGFNMIFLWVFGNTVCAKVGNVSYFALYLILGIIAASTHLLLDGDPAIGASGAVNGVIGFYFALHPVNRIHCFWWVYIRAGSFDIAGYWLILGWFALDLLGALAGGGGIAYWAHIGGFLGGFLLGLIALLSGLVKMTDYDNGTIVDLFRPGAADR